MSAILLGLVYKARIGSPQTKAVLLSLADHAQDDGTNVFPSNERTAYKTELSVNCVRKHMKALAEMGLISLQRSASGKPGVTNMWRINVTALTAKIDTGGLEELGLERCHRVAPCQDATVPPAAETVPPRVGTVPPDGTETLYKPQLNLIVSSPAAPTPTAGAVSSTPKVDVAGQPVITSAIVNEAFELYQTTAKRLGLPVAHRLDKLRREQLEKRLKSFGLDGWREAMRQIEASSWLRGQGEWKGVNLTWLVGKNDVNLTKVIEGTYADSKGSRGAQALAGKPRNPADLSASDRQAKAVKFREKLGDPDKFDRPTWVSEVVNYRSTREWLVEWLGPKPGDPGCKVPLEVLREFNIKSPDEASK